ncbi:hypothetical protein EYF80_057305 [Liparis tanakae]|uniref:Uncharacterized protein n=1 Tax=Liparis tanakae TaxID=230148 RepID=A0A4Z2EUT1_9TELE|nr:hypothetical protein EYF80_057305 [Liparis tanakae]
MRHQVAECGIGLGPQFPEASSPRLLVSSLPGPAAIQPSMRRPHPLSRSHWSPDIPSHTHTCDLSPLDLTCPAVLYLLPVPVCFCFLPLRIFPAFAASP